MYSFTASDGNIYYSRTTSTTAEPICRVTLLLLLLHMQHVLRVACRHMYRHEQSTQRTFI
jgi:hypothetical protein